MRNVAFVVLIVFSAVILFAGCGGGYEGKYVNSANASEYLELKGGGNFFIQEKGIGVSGKWEVKDDNLVLTLPIGLSVSAKITNGRILDKDGKTWVKK